MEKEKVFLKKGTKLRQFLKFSNVASTGGEAKILVKSGRVKVNGYVELRRGYKLKQGDVVEVEGVGSFFICLD